jgi:hypothetical protein
MCIIPSKYLLEYNNKTLCGLIENNATSVDIDSRINMEIQYKGDCIYLNLKNKGSDVEYLNRVELCYDKFDYNDYIGLVQNSKRPADKINYIEIDSIKDKKVINSSLFCVFHGKEQFSNRIIGFLGSTCANCYIKLIIEHNKFEVYVVCDFINQRLESGESFKCNGIFTTTGSNYLQLINRYVRLINDEYIINSRNNIINANNKPNYNDAMIFYSKINSNLVLSKKDSPINIKANGIKYYLLDISNLETREYIISKVKTISKRGEKIVFFSNIYDYLEKAASVKKFNIYYEFSKLLIAIKNEITDIKICFDDCPIGLLCSRNLILQQEIKLNTEVNIFNKLTNKHNISRLDYNFIIKTVLQKINAAYSTKYIISNDKAKELMDVITGNADIGTLKNKELIEVSSDINIGESMIPYESKENIFSFFIRGNKVCYVAILNFTSKNANFFWNFSTDINDNTFNKAAVEIFTKRQVLIADSSIYLREIPPMSCSLVKIIV